MSGHRHAPAAFYPQGKDTRYPLYRKLGGPQSRPGQEAGGKSLCLCQGSNIGRSAVQFIVGHYTDRRTPAPMRSYNPEGNSLYGVSYTSIMILVKERCLICAALKTDIKSIFLRRYSKSMTQA
jgi:hypothetical protein